MAGVPGALIVPVVASLSLDTFAVASAVGMAPIAGAVRLRFVAVCVLAKAAMPLAGFAVGGLAGRLGAAANWLAVLLLFGTGLWVLREALEEDDEVGEALARAQAGGVALIAAAIGVSLDELAADLALGTLRLPPLPVAAAIGGQALLASLAGLRLGVALCAVSIWLAGWQWLGHR